MKRMVVQLIISLILTAQQSFAATLPTDPTGSRSIMVLLSENNSIASERAVFSGRQIYIPVYVFGVTDHAVSLQGTLEQVADNLAAPLLTDLPDLPSVDLSKEHLQQLSIPLTLPQVSRETVFVLTLSMLAQPASPRKMIGRVRLRAYPPDILEPVRQWALRNELRVKDPTKKLPRLLADHQITYLLPEEGRVPDSRKEQLLIRVEPLSMDVGLPQSAQAESPSIIFENAVSQSIIFGNIEDVFPTVVVLSKNGITEVHAQMRILENLLDNPQAQKAFVEIFRMAVVTRKNNDGDFK